jgi:hypothetical protein
MPKHAPRARSQAQSKAQSKSQSSSPAPAAPEHAKPARSVTAAARTGSAGDAAASAASIRTLYCTAVTADRLAQALHLRDSLIAAQGPVDFCLLLAEHPVTVARLRPQLPAIRVLSPDELGCRQWLQMAFYLDRSEYPTALKPALLRTLLAEGNVVYLDAACEVRAPLSELTLAMQDQDLVLSPVLAPANHDRGGPAARDLLRQAALNLSFIAVAQGEAGERFLGWWQELQADCAPAAAEDGPAADELWALAAAATAPRVRALPAGRYNACPPPAATGDDAASAPTADEPLVLVRYPEQDDAAAPPAAEVARYRQAIAASPYQRFAAQPYSFACYLNGAAITDEHRLALWEFPRARRQLVDNPFAAAAPFRRAAPGTAPRLILAPCAQCRDLEHRLNSLPHSLIGYTGKAIDLLAPGIRDHVYNTLQSVSARTLSARTRAAGALDSALPGGRVGLYKAVKAAAASDLPGVRRAATVLLGAVGATA